VKGENSIRNNSSHNSSKKIDKIIDQVIAGAMIEETTATAIKVTTTNEEEIIVDKINIAPQMAEEEEEVEETKIASVKLLNDCLNHAMNVEMADKTTEGMIAVVVEAEVVVMIGRVAVEVVVQDVVVLT